MKYEILNTETRNGGELIVIRLHECGTGGCVDVLVEALSSNTVDDVRTIADIIGAALAAARIDPSKEQGK